mmetsp:Transcript_20740/g.43775  ORF Transcript_20740/g.43775 Transcript_20740/m.43775 type:complete len:235 (+) Transcript_20740:1939-2643(+)
MSMSVIVWTLPTSPSIASPRIPTTASKTRIAISGCLQVRYAVKTMESVPASTFVPALASALTTLSATIPGKENLLTYFSSFLYRFRISWHRPNRSSSKPREDAEEPDTETALDVAAALPPVTGEKKLLSADVEVAAAAAGAPLVTELSSLLLLLLLFDIISVSSSLVPVAPRSIRKVIFCPGRRTVTAEISPSVVDTGHMRSPKAESTARILSPARTAFRASFEALGVKPMIST